MTFLYGRTRRRTTPPPPEVLRFTPQVCFFFLPSIPTLASGTPSAPSVLRPQPCVSLPPPNYSSNVEVFICSSLFSQCVSALSYNIIMVGGWRLRSWHRAETLRAEFTEGGGKEGKKYRRQEANERGRKMSRIGEREVPGSDDNGVGSLDSLFPLNLWRSPSFYSPR